MSVRYVLPVVLRDVCFVDENNGVGAFDDAGYALLWSSEFLSMCILPGVTVFGVRYQVAVFHLSLIHI